MRRVVQSELPYSQIRSQEIKKELKMYLSLSSAAISKYFCLSCVSRAFQRLEHSADAWAKGISGFSLNMKGIASLEKTVDAIGIIHEIYK